MIDADTVIAERLAAAEEEAAESHKAAMNSYGAGYDRGFADALKWVLEELPTELAILEEDEREERAANGPFGAGA